MSPTPCNHIVYWTIPQISADGEIAKEQHYALNLAELEPEQARRVESMLVSHRCPRRTREDDPRDQRTDPAITEYRHLFRPFIEVKKQARDLCRFSMVRLPFFYAEYADRQAEPRHHAHPSVKRLAGAG